MEFLANLRAGLAGKKTYTIVIVMVALVIIEKGLGIDIPNYDPGADWFNDILTAAGIGTLRAGIAKGVFG
jgi:hypothetical protein